MKRVQGIDEPLFISDRDAVLPDEQKLRMRNSQLLAVSSPNRKRPKPAAQPLLQFLHIHIVNLKQMCRRVNVVVYQNQSAYRTTLSHFVVAHFNEQARNPLNLDKRCPQSASNWIDQIGRASCRERV